MFSRRTIVTLATSAVFLHSSTWAAQHTVPGDFKTIQAALDAAAPGDTVAVKAGAYTECVRFKNGVILSGEGRDRVVVRTSGDKGSAFVAEKCGEGAVTGIAFEGSGSPKVVDKKAIEEHTAAPVVLLKDSSIALTDCEVRYGTGDGLTILGTGTPKIEKCVVRKNTGNGVYVKGPGASPTLSHNQCGDNQVNGIFFDAESAGSIEDNQSSKNARDGVLVIGPKSKLTVIRNQCDENGRVGIACANHVHLKLLANTCGKNAWGGIQVYGPSTIVTMEDNVAHDSRGCGYDFDYEVTSDRARNKSTNNGSITRAEVQWMVAESDFAQLEALAERLRKGKARYRGGPWQLADFYDFLVADCSTMPEAAERDFLTWMDAWKKAYPDSITRRITLGEAYTHFAFRERGTGWARNVSETGWQGYHNYLTKAWEVVSEVQDSHPADPHFYALLCELGCDMPKPGTANPLSNTPLVKQLRELAKASNDPTEAAFNEGVKLEPLYFPLYGARLRALQPRWGGSVDATMAFADTAAKITHSQIGEGLYAYIAWATFINEDELDYVDNYKFDWSRIRTGFEDLLKFAETKEYFRSLYCRMACLHRDRETAAKLFSQIDEESHGDIFRVAKKLEAWKNWALKNGPEPKTSELELAIRDHDRDKVAELIKAGVNVNEITLSGESPLGLALYELSMPIMKLLLDAGADINVEPPGRYPAISDAIVVDAPGFVEFLLKHGADPNARSKGGKSPLNMAFSHNRNELAKLLLQHGANPNGAEDEVWTPLRFAIEKDYVDTLQMMLERGADPNINPEPELASPILVYAAEQKNTKACKLLLEHGANPNTPGAENWTALFVAADTGNTELARMLIAKGADVNARQPDGWSIFHMAVKNNAKGVLDLLAEKNPDGLKFVTPKGRNLLHQAAKEGHAEIAKFLLSKGGIDVNAVDNENGKTALAYALASGNKEIVAALRAAGAKE